MTKRQYFRWTPEVKAEIRRLIVLSWTHQQIADHYGISKRSLGNGVTKHKLSSIERAAFNQSVRQRGRKRPASFSKKMTEVNKRRWQDPAMRQTLLKAAVQSLQRVDREKNSRVRRGVDFVGESLEIYRAMRVKKIPKKECIAIVREHERKIRARPHP